MTNTFFVQTCPYTDINGSITGVGQNLKLKHNLKNKQITSITNYKTTLILQFKFQNNFLFKTHHLFEEST